MEELSLEEVINKNGYVLYPFKGISMLPLLDEDFDTVKIVVSNDYKLGDIVLFKKPTGYVLHRIVDIKENRYFMKGDNASFVDEISKENIIGKMDGYFHDNKYISYVNNGDLPLFSLKKEEFLLIRSSHELLNFVLTKECNDKVIKALNEEQLLEFIKFAISKKMAYALYELISKYEITLKDEYFSELKRIALESKSNYLNISIFEEELASFLNKNKIRFIYLKGSEIRPLYKYPHFRVSNDIDLYIGKDSLDKVIKLIEQNYQVIEKQEDDDTHIGLSIGGYNVHIEIHFNIFTSFMGKEILEKYKDPFSLSYQDKENEYLYHLKEEWYYIFNLIHTAKHMVVYQFWFPNLLDFYLLNNKLKNKTSTLFNIDSLGLTTFHESLLGFIDIYMNLKFNEQGYKLYSLENLPLIERRIRSSKLKNRNRLSFIFHKIFVSKKELIAYYPRLENHPILLPFYEIKRWFDRLFSHRGKEALKEIRSYNRYQKENININLNEVGLNEYFVNAANKKEN